MMKQANPGVEQNSQLISLAQPFGGWADSLSSVFSTPHFSASIEGVEASSLEKQNGNQYAESTGMSLFRAERLGHMAPGNGYSVVTDSGTKITDLPLNGAVESGGTAVIVLKNGRVLQLAAGGASTNGVTYTPTSHTPVSSSNGDMIVFRDYASTIKEWAVWSWDYSGGSEVSIVQANNLSTGATDGWYSGLAGVTALKSGVPHKLCAGPDGNIYVLDGAFVQQVVIGSTSGLGAATVGNRLPLGSGWIATGICSFKNYVAIIASNKSSNFSLGQTRVFLWDGLTTTINGVTSTAPEYIFDIPDNFGNGIFFDGNTLFAFANGRNASSKIFIYSSKGFVKYFETPFINSSISAIQGSVENFQDGLIIAALKGDNYGHLFRYYERGFHDEGFVSDGDNLTANIATAIGMCKNLFSNQFFIGVGYSTSFKIFYRNPNTYQTCTATSGPTIDLRTILYTSGILGRRQYPLGFKMSVTRLKLFLSQWGTGASLYLSLFKDYDTCFPGNTLAVNGGIDLMNILIDTNSAIPNGLISGSNPGGYSLGYTHHCYPVGTTEIDLSDFSITDVSSFYMNIRWNHVSPSNVAAMIRRMEIHVAQSQ